MSKVVRPTFLCRDCGKSYMTPRGLAAHYTYCRGAGDITKSVKCICGFKCAHDFILAKHQQNCGRLRLALSNEQDILGIIGRSGADAAILEQLSQHRHIVAGNLKYKYIFLQERTQQQQQIKIPEHQKQELWLAKWSFQNGLSREAMIQLTRWAKLV